MNEYFTCPDCKNHRLEAITTGAVVSHEIVDIHKGGDIEYGKQIILDNGHTEKFQCTHCGYIIQKMLTKAMMKVDIVQTDVLYDILQTQSTT